MFYEKNTKQEIVKMSKAQMYTEHLRECKRRKELFQDKKIINYIQI